MPHLDAQNKGCRLPVRGVGVVRDAGGLGAGVLWLLVGNCLGNRAFKLADSLLFQGWSANAVSLGDRIPAPAHPLLASSPILLNRQILPFQPQGIGMNRVGFSRPVAPAFGRVSPVMRAPSTGLL